MRHKDVIKLITVTFTTDAVGNVDTVYKSMSRDVMTTGAYDPVEDSVNEIFANMFTVSATEYYNAALTGLRPSLMFEIYSFEYSGQRRLEYEGKTYNIIRVITAGEKTRLTCEEVAGV